MYFWDFAMKVKRRVKERFRGRSRAGSKTLRRILKVHNTEEFSLRLVIVTGMSGAGKTTALKTLEDMGFYCADNLPVLLIEKFAELVMNGQSEKQDIALGVDVRSGEELPYLEIIIRKWKRKPNTVLRSFVPGFLR